MTTLVHPTVHLNGTSKDELLQGYLDARTALVTARRALGASGPNARDYYVQGPDAFTQARDQHVARLTGLDDIIGEIEQLAEKLAGLS